MSIAASAIVEDRPGGGVAAWIVYRRGPRAHVQMPPVVRLSATGPLLDPAPPPEPEITRLSRLLESALADGAYWRQRAADAEGLIATAIRRHVSVDHPPCAS